jgi:hypothetical protein
MWNNVLAPTTFSYVVTAHDTNDLTYGVCRAVFVSADCVLNVTFPDGRTLDNMQFAKGWNPQMLKKIRTGADAASVTIEARY